MSENSDTLQLLRQIEGLKRDLKTAREREAQSEREIQILKNQLETLVHAVSVYFNNNR